MGIIDKETNNIPAGDNSVFLASFEDDDEKKKRESETDPFFSEEDLAITNEALRLISIKKELGLDGMDTTYDKEVKGILEWARENGIKNRNQLVAELREVDYLLGDGDGRPKVRRIYEYLKLRHVVRASIRKMEALKK